MQLTREQQEILDGKQGEILQWAMNCLYKYGNAMEADVLIPVTSVHTYVGGPETLTRILSKPGTDITPERIATVMKELSTLKVKSKTTTSPPPNFKKCSPEEATNPHFYETSEMVELTRRLGIQTTLTCTPYLVGNIPIKGETCSWIESSAIVFINSILGAHTNRDGVELTMFSALLGVTPRFGMHLEENREGTHLIEVKSAIENLSDWGALGYFAGDVAGLGIPVFSGAPRPNIEEAKQLSAAVATSGGVTMFHIAGVTPEAESVEKAFKVSQPVETRIFDENVKREMYAHLNYNPVGRVGVVFIGCPHASLMEIDMIADLIQGQKVAEGTFLWIGADHPTITLAERQGSAAIIREAGGKFIERCPITTCTDMSQLERMATNSAKIAHYAVNDLQMKVFFGNLKKCIEIAIKGTS